MYTVEVLNSWYAATPVDPAGGAPVVLLRNLNRDQGRMNGTRDIFLALRPWSFQVQFTTGPRRGEPFVVRRINLSSPDGGDDHIRFIGRLLHLLQ